MDYEKYEKECQLIRKQNEDYLSVFEKALVEQGLSPKTIRRHLDNVDFYLNDYLLYDDVRSMADGISKVDDYLGYFFIRKCMWSTPGTIKSTAASIKKFYKCMLDNGNIENDGYAYLCNEIRTRMAQWQADCGQYNNPDAPDPFDIFGF